MYNLVNNDVNSEVKACSASSPLAGGTPLEFSRESTGAVPLRVLFLPQEISDQMQLMAEALRARGHYATAATLSVSGPGYANDIVLDRRERKGRIRRHLNYLSFFCWALQNYDIFHFHWGRSLLRYRFSPHFDLPILRLFGKKIFVHFRGSDIRNNEVFDYFTERYKGVALVPPRPSEPWQERSLAKWRRYAHGIFVSTPDLLRIVPEATEISQVIDLRTWTRREPRNNGGVFRVAHAPTVRTKKGTEFLIQAVEALRQEGHRIELVLVEGLTPQEAAIRFAQCDVGVDQLLLGWYGKVTVDLMAMGIPVICNIDDELRSHRRFLPVFNATPATIKEVLLRLMQKPSLRDAVVEQGRQYVAEYHSTAVVCERLVRAYQNVRC